MTDAQLDPSSWWEPGLVWRSGPWSLVLRGDELADIAFEGRPALRSVRAVVRDQNWDTASLRVDRVRETESTLALNVHSLGLGSSFRGVVRAKVRAHSLVVSMELASEAEFATNRTGLVVLHPAQVAGAALRVEHTDGSVEQSSFPETISPHQPVSDIRALSWSSWGLEVSLEFAGDIFEMEDQRNWTDASFKTYSRPLALPFPYEVPPGGRVQQMITVRARAQAPAPAGSASAPPDRIALRPGGPFPAVGLSASTAPDPAPAGLPHVGEALLVELDLASTNWQAALRRATESGLALDVRFVLDPARPSAISDGAEALQGVPVARAGAFHLAGDSRHVSDLEAVAGLRHALQSAGIDAAVVGGSRSHFTELNREHHRLPDDLDGLVTTVTPLFHAMGTEQLVESIAMQRLVARQAVGYAAGVPVHIGPICLQPRFNDVARAPQTGPTRDDLAEGYGAQFTGGVDDRQSSPELAAWTIASASALAVPGVASLTYFEEWGPRGIRTATGEPLPVAAALGALASLGATPRAMLLTGDSPDGELWAIGATSPEGIHVLVANMGRSERRIVVSTPSGEVTASLAPGSFRSLSAEAPPAQECTE